MADLSEVEKRLSVVLNTNYEPLWKYGKITMTGTRKGAI